MAVRTWGRADEYVPLFSTWIRDWRQQWGQGEFPFLFVQLANRDARFDHPTDSAVARVREAQFKISSLPNSGMAVAIDLGNVDRHPKEKQDVGRRLALWARENDSRRLFEKHIIHKPLAVAARGELDENTGVVRQRDKAHFQPVPGSIPRREK